MFFSICQSFTGYAGNSSYAGTPIIQGKPVVQEQPIAQGEGSVNLHTQQIKGPTSINVSIDPQDSVLLQTAKVCAINPNESQCMFNVRVIFDGGALRSYITQEFKDVLNLPVLKRDLLLIKTFGSDKEILQECELVQVALKGLNNDLVTYLTLHAVPKICAPIQDQRIEIA